MLTSRLVSNLKTKQQEKIKQHLAGFFALISYKYDVSSPETKNEEVGDESEENQPGNIASYGEYM